MLIAEKIPRELLEREARERYKALHPRAEQSAEAPDPVNHGAAAALFEPVPLLWSGYEYRVRTISYREGLRLQKLTMGFERFREANASAEADVEAHERALDDILALFWSFLDPPPAHNPFTDATPLEVGAIAGFFFTCQLIQNHPARMSAVRLSRTIT